MSALYPTLEDMSVDHMAQAQMASAPSRALAPPMGPPPAQGASPSAPFYPTAPPPYSASPSNLSLHGGVLYPSLNDYMGMEITQEMIDRNRQLVPVNQQVGVVEPTRGGGGGQLVAPITGNSMGLLRAEIKQGIREIVLCKDENGRIGLRVKAVNKGVFVSFVHTATPAALAGLRFGDQILQINGQTVAGWDTDKVTKFLKDAAAQRISFAVRDRPFERTITLQKDSAGTVGFVFKDNKITAIVKDSSAARNGVLIDHHLVEVNGQNVVGLKEEAIKEIFKASGRSVTITILPSFIYEHIMTSIGTGLVKKYMDRSIPDV